MERQTFVQDSISLATNLSELMQSSRKHPIVAPKPCRFVKSAWPPAPRMTVFCCWHAGPPEAEQDEALNHVCSEACCERGARLSSWNW